MIKKVLLRFFSNDEYKGTYGYLESQKKYEIARTIIYFGISALIFIMGWISTKNRMNLLSIVAVLGCLPASKSAVEMIMYLRYKSCSKEYAKQIIDNKGKLLDAFDMVFTSYETNYSVSHIVVAGNNICGFTENKNFNEQGFYKHITDILKLENYKNTSVKIFTDINKYIDRLNQLNQLSDIDDTLSMGIMNTLKSVSL